MNSRRLHTSVVSQSQEFLLIFNRRTLLTNTTMTRTYDLVIQKKLSTLLPQACSIFTYRAISLDRYLNVRSCSLTAMSRILIFSAGINVEKTLVSKNWWHRYFSVRYWGVNFLQENIPHGKVMKFQKQYHHFSS